MVQWNRLKYTIQMGNFRRFPRILKNELKLSKLLKKCYLFVLFSHNQTSRSCMLQQKINFVRKKKGCKKNHCVEYEEKNERADTTNKLNSEDLSCASWFQRASSSLRTMSMFFGGGPKNHHLSPIPWVNGRCKLALIQYICNANVCCTQYRFVRELGWANSFLNVLFKTKTHVLKNVFLHLGFWINFLTIIFFGIFATFFEKDYFFVCLSTMFKLFS